MTVFVGGLTIWYLVRLCLRQMMKNGTQVRVAEYSRGYVYIVWIKKAHRNTIYHSFKLYPLRDIYFQ